MKKQNLFFLIVILIITFLFSGCNTSTPNNNLNQKEMLVHYIDVGQGDSILLQVNNKNLLIDAGPKSDKDKLFKYLNSLNINKLDYIIATHPHEDHIGNMADVIKKYEISSFYAPKIETTTKTFEKMIEALKSKNLKINVIKKGTDSIDLGKNTRVTVFSPIKDYDDNLNNYSPIMKIEYGKTSFLFTGDAEKDVEKDVLSNNADVKSDVLKIGHHGSSSSTSKEFLNKVNPSLSVISVGKDNNYNHPHKETLSALQKNKGQVYRTDNSGTITISSDGSAIKVVK